MAPITRPNFTLDLIVSVPLLYGESSDSGRRPSVSHLGDEATEKTGSQK
jgi:hypothetical protein